MHIGPERKLLMLRPDEILPAKNPTRQSFDDHELRLLADSISANGILQPLSVRRTEAGYELIAGERRLRAAKLAGLRRIPCILLRTDDATAALCSMVENLQRSDLDLFEEAQGIRALIEQFGLSRTETALRLGLAQSTLCNKLRLLQLEDELRDRISAARLTERHARALLRLPPAQRSGLLDEIIAEGLTLRQTEERIEARLHPPAPAPGETEPVRKMAIGDVRLFANSLYKLVDTMQCAGIRADAKKYETDKYIEYKVRINKESLQSGYRQLKIC